MRVLTIGSDDWDLRLYSLQVATQFGELGVLPLLVSARGKHGPTVDRALDAALRELGDSHDVSTLYTGAPVLSICLGSGFSNIATSRLMCSGLTNGLESSYIVD